METIPLIRVTTAQILKDNAQKYPEKTAYIFDDRRYSWQETDEITDKVAMYLIRCGIEKGDHVGFWSVNHIGLVFFLLAAMKIGAVPVVINYSYRVYELGNVLRRARVEYFFLGERKKNADYRAMAEQVLPHCPELKQIRELLPVLQELPGMCFSHQERNNLQQKKERVQPDDVACITFTSGTTKVPKPVMLTHYNLINNARQFTFRMRVSPENNDVMVAPLPLFHSSGITGMLYHGLVTAITAIIHPMFRVEKALADIVRYRVSVLMAVPSMLEMLAEQAKTGSYDLSSLRVGQSSGSAITPERLLQVVSKLGIKHFLMGYGQTECSPLVTTTLYDDDLPKATASAGLPLPYVQMRIWDCKQQAECEAGQVGEIQVQGFNVMKGYFDSPEENQEKFTSDGWLKTTDLGYVDSEGRLHFVARSSEIIIRHGENISPAEIEAVARQFSNEITAVKVVGVPEPIVQEEIACLVQTNSEALDLQELRQYIKGMLASYKVPKYMLKVTELPMTATGKIDHAAVKRIAEDYASAQRNENN